MRLATIEMDRSEAVQKFREYRDAVRARHDEEDEAIMRGYRELGRGRQLLRLSETMRAGGHDELRRPRLAIAQATAVRVQLHRSETSNGVRCSFHSIYAGQDETRWRGHTCAWRQRRCVGGVEIPVHPGAYSGRVHDEYSAIVPSVPPALRPKDDLAKYHVLFEAEWQRVVPIDPALVRYLGGDLWVVLAVWDLTELERSVLAGRADA